LPPDSFKDGQPLSGQTGDKNAKLGGLGAAGMSAPKLPELGVGIIYSSEFEQLIRDTNGLIQVAEIEPQTLWTQITENGQKRFKILAGVLDQLADLPCAKLVHSVGAPVGGTVAPPPAQLDLLRQWVERLGAPWASEHLAFNSTVEFHTGFFLAPRQTRGGVMRVTESIRCLKAAMPVPVAVETGVNYLRPRRDELPDGQFIAETVEAADCGILLDLHNVYTNALNGRQSVDEFLSQIPLERVWEIHIAGGMEMDGFWLDGHCDVVPERLMEIARSLLPALPNVKALIFEVFPAFIPAMGMDKIRGQIESLHEIWRERGRPRGDGIFRPLPVAPLLNEPESGPTSVEEWERAFGHLVIGRRPEDSRLSRELASDPGLRIIHKLVREFRASLLVNVLRLTVRLLMLSLGEKAARTVLQAFWEETPPQMYATTEAEAFAAFLDRLNLKIPQLAKVLAFERALLATVMDDQPRVVAFDSDPIPLLRALADGRLPDIVSQPGPFEIEVTPDDFAGTDASRVALLGPNTQGH
jgi:uncharacterized protein (UPF0276 family)